MEIKKARNARASTDLTRAIADQIAEEQQNAHLTQVDVYTAAGVTKSTYGRIQDGTRSVDFATAEKIAAVFGLSLGALISRAEARLVENLQVTTLPEGSVVAIPMPEPASAQRQPRAPRRTSPS